METVYIQTNDEGRVIGFARFPFAEDAIEVETDADGDLCEYVLKDGELVHDNTFAERMRAETERFMEIANLKGRLGNSDYSILKFSEALLEVNSLADFLSLIIRTRAELRETIRQRAEWRRQINELEERNDNQGN